MPVPAEGLFNAPVSIRYLELARYPVSLSPWEGIVYNATTKKIGLSLSFCIKDILLGRVALEEVDRLITGTCAVTDEDWEEVLESYCEVYWRDFPEQAKELANKVRSEGRISQPKCNSRKAPFVGRTHWVNSEVEIEYVALG
jgi:hypothetical protein